MVFDIMEFHSSRALHGARGLKHAGTGSLTSLVQVAPFTGRVD